MRICASIDTALSITTISKLKDFAQLDKSAVESAIKQIDRRIQVSGAQWNVENVPQVLAHRCAYLNGLIGSQP